MLQTSAAASSEGGHARLWACLASSGASRSYGCRSRALVPAEGPWKGCVKPVSRTAKVPAGLKSRRMCSGRSWPSVGRRRRRRVGQGRVVRRAKKKRRTCDAVGVAVSRADEDVAEDAERVGHQQRARIRDLIAQRAAHAQRPTLDGEAAGRRSAEDLHRVRVRGQRRRQRPSRVLVLEHFDRDELAASRAVDASSHGKVDGAVLAHGEERVRPLEHIALQARDELVHACAERREWRPAYDRKPAVRVGLIGEHGRVWTG